MKNTRMQIMHWKKDDKISSIQKIAYLYLALPIFIFFTFWLKPIYGVIAEIIILYTLIHIWLCPNVRRDKIRWEDYKKWLFCIFIVCIWVYFSGIGKFVYQNGDHGYRNSIFHTLVTEHWPVQYESLGEVNRPVAFVYYFAFWLPAAVVGKLFSLRLGFIVQAIWAVIGICLMFGLICEIRGKINLYDLIIFIFFSGLDVIGAYLLNVNTKLIAPDHLEWWVGMQYSSFTTQLFWVFNQAIPAWLITVLLLAQKNRYNVVFIYSFSILSCPLPAVGLIPILAYKAISCGYQAGLTIKENIIKLIKEICTFNNVVSGGIIGIICYLFLCINNNAQTREIIHVNITAYLLFLFFEAAVYFLLLYKYWNKSGWYYVCVLSLTVIPFFRVGSSGDFCMRASIPALVLLYLLVVETIKKSFHKKDIVTFICLLSIILIGSITPIHEAVRTFQNTISGNLNQYEIDLRADGMRNNFFGYTEESFFFRYLINNR